MTFYKNLFECVISGCVCIAWQTIDNMYEIVHFVCRHFSLIDFVQSCQYSHLDYILTILLPHIKTMLESNELIFSVPDGFGTEPDIHVSDHQLASLILLGISFYNTTSKNIINELHSLIIRSKNEEFRYCMVVESTYCGLFSQELVKQMPKKSIERVQQLLLLNTIRITELAQKHLLPEICGIISKYVIVI